MSQPIEKKIYCPSLKYDYLGNQSCYTGEALNQTAKIALIGEGVPDTQVIKAMIKLGYDDVHILVGGAIRRAHIKLSDVKLPEVVLSNDVINYQFSKFSKKRGPKFTPKKKKRK